MSKYSTSQMDNFYYSFSKAHVKPSGVMNYIQHLFIAEQCGVGTSVLDICCGRELMLPLLKNYASQISLYVGIDISFQNLSEAKNVFSHLEDERTNFPCYLIRADVSKLPLLLSKKFDVVIYTSALEHLDREAGLNSLKEISNIMSDEAILYLSTPNTLSNSQLQYKVHVFEWDFDDLGNTLNNIGLRVTKRIGLLPPSEDVFLRSLEKKYGLAGIKWYNNLKLSIPVAFLAPILAADFPEQSKEIMFICKKSKDLKWEKGEAP